MNKKHEQIKLNYGDKEVRIIKNKEYYVVANELAEALGYKNGRSVVFNNVSEENKLLKLVYSGGQYRDMTVLNVDGINELISKCQLKKINTNVNWIKKNVISLLNQLNGETDIFGAYQKLITKNEGLEIDKQMQDSEITSLRGTIEIYRNTVETQKDNLINKEFRIEKLENERCFVCKIREKLGLSKS